MAFTPKEHEQLECRGIPVEEAERQLAQLRRGQAYLPIERPCTIGDGIRRVEEVETIELCRAFAGNRPRFTRFVPASGAASRMFQGLFPEEADPDKVAKLRKNLERLPFYAELCDRVEISPGDLSDTDLLNLLLGDDELDLASQPKGLLPLHAGGQYNRTAFAEHLHESHRLGIRHFHFTVSPPHRDLFQQELETVAAGLKDGIEATFSIQALQTDTLALDRQSNGPFHDEQGDLLFRPAGHGALLTNLAQCRGDLVLIRNIDNVVPQPRHEPYQFWTEILGGLLLKTQERVFALLETLEETPDAGTCSRARVFLQETFGRGTDDSAMVEELTAMLSRPIRICGMVPVSGQPGGGPFWARDAFGQRTPQIVEGVQIDPDDSAQQEILGASTHFNPVNIACSLRDRQGQPYQLSDFVDENAAIITAKNHAGRDLLALERPGLWNGAMSGWNTIFVEMPAETFNPVKTVFDLLQPAHQVDP